MPHCRDVCALAALAAAWPYVHGQDQIQAAVIDVNPTPPALSTSELATCLAAAERRCRMDFRQWGGAEVPFPAILTRGHKTGQGRVDHINKANRLYRTQCITAVATAKAIANDSLVQEKTTLEHTSIPARYRGDAGSEWSYVPAVLRQVRPCLVYAFGVQHSDEFVRFYAASRCEVFAFDPTVTYYTERNHTHGKRLHNVTFLSWGLTSTEAGYPYAEASNLGALYGALSGKLYTLPQIVTMLGHRGRTITALKLDCEGCEFAAFRDLWCEERLQAAITLLPLTAKRGSVQATPASSDAYASPPPALPMAPVATITIASVVLEAHLMYSEILPRLGTSADVERIRYLGLWLHDHAYKSFQYRIHKGSAHGYRGGVRSVPPDLEAAGIAPETCCYLMGFVREDLVREERPQNRHDETYTELPESPPFPAPRRSRARRRRAR